MGKLEVLKKIERKSGIWSASNFAKMLHTPRHGALLMVGLPTFPFILFFFKVVWKICLLEEVSYILPIVPSETKKQKNERETKEKAISLQSHRQNGR